VIIEREAINIAQVARLADSQNHRFHEAIEAAEQLLW